MVQKFPHVCCFPLSVMHDSIRTWCSGSSVPTTFRRQNEFGRHAREHCSCCRRCHTDRRQARHRWSCSTMEAAVKKVMRKVHCRILRGKSQVRSSSSQLWLEGVEVVVPRRLSPLALGAGIAFRQHALHRCRIKPSGDPCAERGHQQARQRFV